MTFSAEDCFNIELLKLLLQMAWADRDLAPAERQFILGLGRSWSVPEGALHKLMGLLEEGAPLPEPDLEVLRTRPDDVMEAVRALSVADGKLAAGEKGLLDRIIARLGLPVPD